MSETGRKFDTECALRHMPLRTTTAKELADAVMDELRDSMPHVDYATTETRILAAMMIEREHCAAKKGPKR